MCLTLAKAKSAISLGVSAVIVIVLILVVGFGVFLSNDLNSTNTITTADYSGSSSSSTESSQTATTTIFLPTEQSSSSTSASGLSLDLFIAPSNGSLGEVIEVNEINTLDSINNVSLADNWLYPQSSLDPYAPCSLTGAVGFAIFQGNYGLNNYTHASALALYNTSDVFSCTTATYQNAYYSFMPQSDQANLVYSQMVIPSATTTLSLSFIAKGFWTGGSASGQTPTFHAFQGNYTVLAADEWGKVVLIHFTASSAGISSGTTSTTGYVTSNSSSPTVTTTSTVNWNYGMLANLTLNSPKVLPYIESAYSYVVSMYPDHYGPNLMTVIIDVNGSQSVVGNYTTGYTITYSGIKVLNATVQFITPSSYFLAGVGVTNLPNQTESVSFSSQEQHIVQVALSNSTVQKLMGATSSYYVEYIDQFPIQNGTYGGDYFVFLFQINGTRTIGIFVNPGITAVVNAYADTRIITFCYGPLTPGACFTSPWNATTS